MRGQYDLSKYELESKCELQSKYGLQSFCFFLPFEWSSLEPQWLRTIVLMRLIKAFTNTPPQPNGSQFGCIQLLRRLASACAYVHLQCSSSA